MRLCSVLSKLYRLPMHIQQKKLLILLLVLLTCAEIFTINAYDMARLTKEPNAVKNVKQSKRDLSLSYAATNIDSNEGTRVKTITVIKNIGNKHENYAINPDSHKNDNWADAFRDNFDSYGKIPDVPDIDDLFEFMNKQPKPIDPPKDNSLLNSPKLPMKHNNNSNHISTKEKPVKELTDDFDFVGAASSSKNVTNRQSSIEKIEGDAELIPRTNKRVVNNNNPNNNNNNNSNKAGRSESISALELNSGSSNTKQRLIDINYSTPQHTVSQYFDTYLQLPNVGVVNGGRDNSQGYDYLKPCNANTPTNSINIATPSGRTYDIPVVNGRNISGIINPYLAPAVTKRPQQPAVPQQPSTQLLPAQISIQFPSQINFTPNISSNMNRTPFSVNSLVSPLNQQQQQQQQQTQTQQQQGQSQQQIPQLQIQVTSAPPSNSNVNSNVIVNNANANNNNNNINQTPFPQTAFTTSQRPYTAPNLRNGLSSFSRGAPVYSVSYGRNNNNNNNNNNSYRPGIFSYGPMRALFSRSRGLKY